MRSTFAVPASSSKDFLAEIGEQSHQKLWLLRTGSQTITCSRVPVLRARCGWNRLTMFAKENKLATIVGEKTAGRLLSATSDKVGHGFRLALPVGAYFTWSGVALEGSPIEPDIFVPFSWQERSNGFDGQLEQALKLVASPSVSSHH